MIAASTREHLRRALDAGLSDRAAAEQASCHFNTARSYRHLLERVGLIPVIVSRSDRNGRVYDAGLIGRHIPPSQRPQSNRRRLCAIAGLPTSSQETKSAKTRGRK
jgi:hypothetical protein